MREGRRETNVGEGKRRGCEGKKVRKTTEREREKEDNTNKKGRGN